jgi:predicted RNA-binding Zn-ribbon protein involved in translation (DUF1610 family)
MATQKHCPACGSARVHRSHRRGGFERMLCSIGVEIRRCHDCRSRQAWLRSARLSLPTEGVASKRLTSIALLGSTFAVCLLFIWWMISRFTELAG